MARPMTAKLHLDEQGDARLVPVTRVAAPVREQMLDQLRSAILDRRFPPGTRLNERQIARDTGVSRTTIREALRELAADGLVETVPNRGAVVAEISHDEAAEIYLVRAMLEGVAGRQFTERASTAQVQELRRAFEELRVLMELKYAPARILQAKVEFNDILFAGFGNVTIRSLLHTLQARVTLLRNASLSLPGRPEVVIGELREIVEAVEARDPDAAERACVHHAEQAARVALEAMDAAAADPAKATEG